MSALGPRRPERTRQREDKPRPPRRAGRVERLGSYPQGNGWTLDIAILHGDEGEPVLSLRCREVETGRVGSFVLIDADRLNAVEKGVARLRALLEETK